MIEVDLTQGWDPRRGPMGDAGNIRVQLDQYSGRVLSMGDPDDFNVATQLYDRWTFPLHIGSFGGLGTRVTWLPVAAAPVALFASGLRNRPSPVPSRKSVSGGSIARRGSR